MLDYVSLWKGWEISGDLSVNIIDIFPSNSDQTKGSLFRLGIFEFQ